MNITFRPYKDSDYPTIFDWWDRAGEPGPVFGAMVPETTIVAEADGEALMTLSVFSTPSPEICYLEGFIAKPGLETTIRRHIGTLLWGHCIDLAKAKGCRGVQTYTRHEGLINRYEELGMERCMGGLTALSRRF